jgi:hypothetical protein
VYHGHYIRKGRDKGKAVTQEIGEDEKPQRKSKPPKKVDDFDFGSSSSG